MATKPADQTRGEAEAAAVIRWRRDLLLEVGFDELQADVVARESRMDVHALIGLVDRGCPPALAVRILAPLEGWPAR